MSDAERGARQISYETQPNGTVRRVVTYGAAPIKPDVCFVVDNFINSDAERFRTALQQIASADLKRVSAGWLRDIAQKALGEGDG